MANVKAKLKSKVTGDVYYLATLAELVTNAKGETLENVEAGAQVNVLEGVQLNGTDVTIGANKKANIVLPAAAEYTMVKQEEAEEGYASTYYLAKDNVQVGAKINLAKDQVLQNVELKQCETAGTPIADLKVGDYYFEFTFQNKETPIYLAAKALTDVYTAGAGLTLTNGQFAVNTEDTAIQGEIEENSKKFVQAGKIFTALNGKQDNIEDLDDIRDNATAGKAAKDAVDAMGDIVSHNANEFADASHNHAIADVTGLQDALSAKQDEITVTAAKALVSDNNGKVSASAVTATELGLLSGMTDMLVIEPISE